MKSSAIDGPFQVKPAHIALVSAKQEPEATQVKMLSFYFVVSSVDSVKNERDGENLSRTMHRSHWMVVEMS